MRRQISRDESGRTATNVVKSSFERGADFFRLAYGFSVTVFGLRKLGEIRRRIEDSAFVIARAHCHTVRVSSHQTVGAGRIGAVDKHHAQESCLVVRSSPERGQRCAKHQIAVAACENDVAIWSSKLGADARADSPTPR